MQVRLGHLWLARCPVRWRCWLPDQVFWGARWQWYVFWCLSPLCWLLDMLLHLMQLATRMPACSASRLVIQKRKTYLQLRISASCIEQRQHSPQPPFSFIPTFPSWFQLISFALCIHFYMHHWRTTTTYSFYSTTPYPNLRSGPSFPPSPRGTGELLSSPSRTRRKRRAWSQVTPTQEVVPFWETALIGGPYGLVPKPYTPQVPPVALPVNLLSSIEVYHLIPVWYIQTQHSCTN